MHYMFFAGDAAKLIGVDRATINRWLRSGKMNGHQLPNGYWLMSLDDINEVRRKYRAVELTKENIDEYWKTGYVYSEIPIAYLRY